jgi:hypothetical protein
VVFDPLHSHAITHFRDTLGPRELVEEVLPSQVLDDEVALYDIDMERVIGRTDGVDTDKTDDIVYAKRLNRHTYTYRYARQGGKLNQSFLFGGP